MNVIVASIPGLRQGQDWKTGRHTPSKNTQQHPNIIIPGSAAEWSTCETCNPASLTQPAELATCWICSWLSRVQILNQAFK